MEERKSFRGRLVFVSIFTAIAALGLYLTLSLFVSARFGTAQVPASSVDSAGSVSSVSPAGQVAGGFALGLALGVVLVMAIMFVSLYKLTDAEAARCAQENYVRLQAEQQNAE